ncbi:protein of unknown function DUF1680 [Xylanimonas cellulosilytica DSM 15894]|uniref:Glycoside hydrolase family 127 protein n=1 Tax=Xylanimonas cellulosilytica (strain DSM 15894 / JCM 12276 / CECT 5975 / KCTC 9989 / LMG 20990 / NBRC 107835 / XIL07) TaxID=446471 RepID=D1BVH5_XYLCX|nr:beta-L-arabinofuranosidase domain-containing protein [Xylanimonas cellulosilytica]ACZ29446.1 protein of unknown function DUF1680 [Xylanimonas cellulosilytica DSM 15894]
MTSPVRPSTGALRPLGLHDVTIDGGFWGERQALNAAATIPHVEAWLERLGWTGNFDAAVEGRLPADRAGREFSDSEIYKLLEGMAWEIGRTGSVGLEARFTALAARVSAAQEPDGYLNTMFGRPGQKPRYSDLQWGHELYCFGHLIQAGVARARTHGHDAFVETVVRAADHVCEQFGPDGDQRVCGHPEIEVALAELARVTGERRYLDQARAFVERRGHGVLGDIELGTAYFQDDVPVRETEVFAGHAVRALYLAAGAVDVALETGDDELLAAVAAATTRTLARRTYLTGGMGAHHEGESFGVDFELPPDRSYSETCAGIASVMLNHRLLLATGEARYADAVERTLFNVVATSPAADGRGFYYTNTLHQRVPGKEVVPDEVSPRASSSLRAPFFAVSCCPTNLTRTFASLGAYVATASDDGVQLQQYAPGAVRASLPAGPVELAVRTAYPADGRIEVEVVQAPVGAWDLTLRVPAWAVGATVAVDDGAPAPADPGYVTVAGPGAGGVVVLDLPMAPRWTFPDPRIDAVRGQVAVERGPIVMALESVDLESVDLDSVGLGADVGAVRVRTDVAPRVHDGRVQVPVTVVEVADGDWPYGQAAGPAAGQERCVDLVEYHAWAERGPSTMRVWMPVR